MTPAPTPFYYSSLFRFHERNIFLRPRAIAAVSIRELVRHHASNFRFPFHPVLKLPHHGEEYLGRASRISSTVVHIAHSSGDDKANSIGYLTSSRTHFVVPFFYRAPGLERYEKGNTGSAHGTIAMVA